MSRVGEDMKARRASFRIWPVKDKFEILFPLGVMLMTSALYTITSVELEWKNFLYQIGIMFPIILGVHLYRTQFIYVGMDYLKVRRIFSVKRIYFNDINHIFIKEYVTEASTVYSLVLYGEQPFTIKDIESFKREDVIRLLEQLEASQEQFDALDNIIWYGARQSP